MLELFKICRPILHFRGDWSEISTNDFLIMKKMIAKMDLISENIEFFDD